MFKNILQCRMVFQNDVLSVNMLSISVDQYDLNEKVTGHIPKKKKLCI